MRKPKGKNRVCVYIVWCVPIKMVQGKRWNSREAKRTAENSLYEKLATGVSVCVWVPLTLTHEEHCMEISTPPSLQTTVQTTS